MKINTIKKFFYIFSISLLVILTAASCDENNNMMSGGDDKPLNGDGGVGPDPTPMPTPVPTFKPVLGFSGVGIDYDPEARCSTNNWSTDFPVACSPQVGFKCPGGGNDTLDNCPTSCQSCYDSDLTTISSTLGVGTITIYQPNYYILTAAKANNVKVVLGLFNDTVAALASRHCSIETGTMCVTDSDCGATGGTCEDDSSGCTYASSTSLCGTGAADSLLNGACGSTTPWPAATFCESTGAYIPPNADFITDGTVIGIQVGNEVLSSSDPVLTKDEVVNAAKVLTNALTNNSLTNVPMIVSLEVGNEQSFCESGAPPEGVDLIAAHPYCDFVASVPPMWPDETGNTAEQAAELCWSQVKSLFIDNAVKYCGAENTYIGETGYNTGCPGATGESTHLAVTPHFIDDFLTWSCDNDTGSFLFAFVDACPMGGCEAGCSSSSTTAGNGYFGLYHTDNYDTMGSLVQKYTPLPSLTCP